MEISGEQVTGHRKLFKNSGMRRDLAHVWVILLRGSVGGRIGPAQVILTKRTQVWRPGLRLGCRRFNRFVMIESNQCALASRVRTGLRFVRFPVTVRGAAILGAPEHEILFAGDASTPDKGREKE